MLLTAEQDPLLLEVQAPRPVEMLDPAAMEVRVGAALETCDFVETPELRDAMTGYFTDHYSNAAAIDSVLTTDLTVLTSDERTKHISDLEMLIGGEDLPENFEAHFTTLLETGHFATDKLISQPLLLAVRAARLDRPEDATLRRAELQLLASLTYNLFAESAIGVDSITEEEMRLAGVLNERVKGQVEQSGLFDAEDGYIPRDLNMPGKRSKTYNSIQDDFRDPRARITEASNRFWGNMRHAGQLLFHGTRSHEAIRQSGALLPRRMQRQVIGRINAANEDVMNNKIWSPMVHWSETFHTNAGRFNDGAVIGYPLEKIIENAPYGRDMQFGSLQVKEDRAQEVLDRVPILAELGYPDRTGDDAIGDHTTGGGAVLDRSFYSSPHDVDPSAPLESAPDGHVFPLDDSSVRIITMGAEEDAEAYGRGEGVPTPFGIWTALSRAELSQRSPEEVRAAEKHAVEELVASSIDQRKGRIVLPLRAGVFDFSVSDEGPRSQKPRAKFNLVE